MDYTASNTPSLTELFFSFLQLGATAFGGPAIVPHIRSLTVQRKGWIKGETFDNVTALAQIVPGAITVQIAAYVGLQVRGLPGALSACTGYVLPSFLLMLGLSALYEHFQDAAAAAAGFSGLRVVVIALLAHAALCAGRAYIKNKTRAAVALAAALLFGFGANPVFVIVAAGLAGRLVFASACREPATGLPQPVQVKFAPAGLLFAISAAGFALLYLYDKMLFWLGLLMAKVDLFAFGGGYTSVPLMFHEIVEVRGWLSGQMLLDGIALGQLTPGPIGITATFVGYVLKGAVGATAATLCVFLPSFLIVVLLSPGIDRLRQKKGFDCFVAGILCSFVGLLASTVFYFSRNLDWSWGMGMLAASSFAALYVRVPVLFVLLGGIAAAGVLL